MKFFADRTIYDTENEVYYEPFVSPDGRVGYRVATTRLDGKETYVYLNPSDGGDTPTVFVYVGGENDPTADLPSVFVVPEEVLEEERSR